MFPSPVGVLHVSIKMLIKVKNHYIECFRPLSGSYMFLSYADLVDSIALHYGFRPLSGSYMFLSKLDSEYNITRFSFPSPVGVLHVSI